MKRPAPGGEELLSVLLWSAPMLLGVCTLVLYHIGEGHSVSEAIAEGTWVWVVGGIFILLVVRHYVRRLSHESRERGLRTLLPIDADGLSKLTKRAKPECPHCDEKLTGFIVACPACGKVTEWSSVLVAGAIILLAFALLAYAHFMSR